MGAISDEQFRALLGWAERERAMNRLSERGKLSPVDCELARQSSLHRLLRERNPR